MDLATFLTAITRDSFIAEQKIFGFKGTEFSLLFFNLFKRFLKKKDFAVQAIDLHEEDTTYIQSHLRGSFLGQEIFYWLGDLSLLDARKKRYWLDYISSYTGPHKIGFFIDEAELFKFSFVELPALVTEQLYQDLQTISAFDAAASKVFIKKLFSYNKNISLDTACLLLEYQGILGTGTQLFMDSWLKKLLPMETSLFHLAQHFFAKSPTAFLSLWKNIRHEYPDIFWITFWSEQVWRAYYVVQLYKEKKIVEAKKISYRLPFSFMQKDWRIAKSTELRAAHHYLYMLDFNLKNGVTQNALDLFFIKFFIGHFAR